MHPTLSEKRPLHVGGDGHVTRLPALMAEQGRSLGSKQGRLGGGRDSRWGMLVAEQPQRGRLAVPRHPLPCGELRGGSRRARGDPQEGSCSLLPNCSPSCSLAAPLPEAPGDAASWSHVPRCLGESSGFWYLPPETLSIPSTASAAGEEKSFSLCPSEFFAETPGRKVRLASTTHTTWVTCLPRAYLAGAGGT